MYITLKFWKITRSILNILNSTMTNLIYFLSMTHTLFLLYTGLSTLPSNLQSAGISVVLEKLLHTTTTILRKER